jgi:ribosome-associated protein
MSIIKINYKEINLKGLKKIYEVITDTKVENIKIYETKTINPLFDYAIIVTAKSSRQMQSVINHLRKEEKTGFFKVKSVEGKGGSSWILIDLYDYIVNVFLEAERNVFGLDEVFSELPQININK